MLLQRLPRVDAVCKEVLRGFLPEFECLLVTMLMETAAVPSRCADAVPTRAPAQESVLVERLHAASREVHAALQRLNKQGLVSKHKVKKGDGDADECEAAWGVDSEHMAHVIMFK